MYLEVSPAGGKYWRLKYRIAGKEKRLALGVDPEISAMEARIRRDAARKLLADGIDLGVERKVQKSQVMNVLLTVSKLSLENVCPAFAGLGKNARLQDTRWENDVFPWPHRAPGMDEVRTRLCRRSGSDCQLAAVI